MTKRPGLSDDDLLIVEHVVAKTEPDDLDAALAIHRRGIADLMVERERLGELIAGVDRSQAMREYAIDLIHDRIEAQAAADAEGGTRP